MKRMKYSIAIWIFLYLTFCFVLADLNPMQWQQQVRALYVVLSVFINTMYLTYPGFNETK